MSQTNLNNTRIAIILRNEMPPWQCLNVTAFIASCIASNGRNAIGAIYVDRNGTQYSSWSNQPVTIFQANQYRLSQIFPNPGGEMFIVLEGVERKPHLEEEVKLLLIEPRNVRNTGDEASERTAQNDVWI